MRLRRAALLLRIQTARERRGRLAVSEAERRYNAAVLAERTTRERRQAHATEQEGRLREAHASMRGRVVDLDALQRLHGLERDLQDVTAALQRALVDAEGEVERCQSALRLAQTELRTQTRATRKRERLAERLTTVWRSAAEAAEEDERDQQAADERRRA